MNDCDKKISYGGYMSVDRTEAFNDNLELIKQIVTNCPDPLQEKITKLETALKIAVQGLKLYTNPTNRQKHLDGPDTITNDPLFNEEGSDYIYDEKKQAYVSGEIARLTLSKILEIYL